MPSTAEKIFTFYKNLQPPAVLPNNIEWLYPQQDKAIMKTVKQFLQKFYNDSNKRNLIVGINPGRFGAGITGVNFTAPRQLIVNCGIQHSLGNSSEFSAEFIYEVIEQYGGPEIFYKDWFLGSVCPLGFVQDGVNINYYDDKKLKEAVTPFIIKSITGQVSFTSDNGYCICIGGAKNFNFLSKLNEEHGWFKKVVPLPHPRFIMQYKRKEKQKYIEEYISALRVKTISF